MSEPDRSADAILAEILARKAEGRREIAKRSFGEKIEMMEALRERLEPFKRAREEWRAARQKKPKD